MTLTQLDMNKIFNLDPVQVIICVYTCYILTNFFDKNVKQDFDVVFETYT